MEIEHPFSGSAIGVVGAGGELLLPPFVLAVLARRGGEGRIVFGAHDSAPCLAAYDPGHLPRIGGEIERLKRLDDARGGDAEQARARRAFGFSEEATVDAAGGTTLPLLLRRKGRIGGRALFVGVGPVVEIWDAEAARGADDPTLRELAAFRLEQQEEKG